MVTSTFKSVDGDWSAAADWFNGVTPGEAFPYQDAAFSTGSVVLISDLEHVGSVSSGSVAPTITIRPSGVLRLGGGSSTGDGTLDLASGSLTLQVGGVLGANGITPATLKLDGGTLVAAGGTLDDIVIQGVLDLSSGDANLVSINGLSATGSNSRIDLTGSGATLEVPSSEAISNALISMGAPFPGVASTLQVYSGATLTLNNDTLTFYPSGDVSAIIAGQGTLVIGAGSRAVIYGEFPLGGAIYNYARVTISTSILENDGTISANDLYTASGSNLTITGAITGSGSITANDTIDLQSSVSASQTITITTTGRFEPGQLTLDAVTARNPYAVRAQLFFQSSSVVQLGLAYTATELAAVSGGVLTITDGGVIEAALNIPALPDSTHVTLAKGTIGTEVFVGPACYCRGTLIATSRGELAVEKLGIGDTVVTASGQHRLIKWIGRRSYAGRFLAANPAVQPIRFCAGSLGDGLPRRDLLVSPMHAMFLDEVLVPARELVNARTIVRANADLVDYFHVELDTHDVILAEGAPSESFVDDDSRALFHNGHEFAALYPEAPAPSGACAPRVESGFQLEAIRARLAGVASEVALAA